MKRFVFAAGCGAVALSLSACKPPSMEQGGGDWPVSAIVAQVEEERIEDAVSLVGSLQARDAIDLVSEIDAVVEEMGFTEGEPVRKGTVLFRLDEAKLKAGLEVARARFKLAETNFKRNEELLKNQTISQQEFDQVLANFEADQAALDLAEEQLADAIILAPFDGVTGERRVSVGQFVNRGTVLGSLVKMNPLEAVFDVPERYLGQLTAGRTVTVRTAAYGDEGFDGEVFFVAPRVDERDRTVRVKAEIPNPDGRLKPGMFGNLALVLAVKDAALTVPESCIKYRGDDASVVVMNEEGKAEFRPVQVGIRLKGRVEVTDGLVAGERVVAEGHQKIFPGGTILIAPGSERYGVTPPPQEEPTAS